MCGKPPPGGCIHPAPNFMNSTTAPQYMRRLQRDAANLARRYRALHPERQAELLPELERTRADLEAIWRRLLG